MLCRAMLCKFLLGGTGSYVAMASAVERDCQTQGRFCQWDAVLLLASSAILQLLLLLLLPLLLLCLGARSAAWAVRVHAQQWA